MEVHMATVAQESVYRSLVCAKPLAVQNRLEEAATRLVHGQDLAINHFLIGGHPKLWIDQTE